MFSQRSIMIGFIILIVACLVMYGCSSTSIKEGLGPKGASVSGNVVSYNGKQYRTLTGVDPDAAMGTNNTSCPGEDANAAVPSGWKLAENTSDGRLVAASFPWNTNFLVMADGTAWWTSTPTPYNVSSPQANIGQDGYLCKGDSNTHEGTWEVCACNGAILLEKGESSPPQMLCVTGAAIGKTGISPNGTYTLQSDNPPWWLMQSSVNDGTINWTISQGSVEGQSVVPTGTWWFLCGYKNRVPSGGGGSGAGDALGCWNSSQIVGTKPVSALKLPPMGVWKVGQGTDAGNTKWQSFKGNICLSKCPPPKNACPNLDKNACVPGFSTLAPANLDQQQQSHVNSKEECRNTCNNNTDCAYWGWYPNNLTTEEIHEVLDASPNMNTHGGSPGSWRTPGLCYWLTKQEPGDLPTAEESEAEYQKLCSWGGTKNCSFTNVPKCPRDAPPKCPDGWEEVTYQGQALGADINGCGMDDCGDRFDKNNIQQCADWCTAAGNQCKSFTWAPVGGDEYVTKKISNTPVCTRYTSDQPNQVLRGIDGQEKQIMCKPSAPPPKGCVDSPTDWSTVSGSCQGGLTCEDYAQQGWCANGGKAWNWGPCGLQKFSRDGWDLGTDGKTAAEACCVCGGGTKSPPKGCGSNCCTGGGDTVNGQCCCNSNTTCGGEDCSYYDDGSGGGGGGVGSGTLSLGKNAILLNVDKYSKKL